MAKVTSAERVSPITRANYTGNPNDIGSDVDYDPLAALASLVGNIEKDVALSNEPVVDEVSSDLESELIADFHSTNTLSPSQGLNFSDIENELSIALGEETESVIEAGVGEANLGEADNPAHSIVEQIQSEPVLQSFESLQTAFGVLQKEEDPSEGATEVDLDDLAIEEKLLQELSIDPTSVYGQNEPEGGPFTGNESHGEPYVATANAQHPELITENGELDFADIFERPVEIAADNIAVDLPVDDGFTADFEAAMAGNVAELIEDSQVEVIAAAAELPVIPQAVEPVDEEFPFGTLAEAVTMPPVSTPFDHQVDGALNEILTDEIQPDHELGWSGDLAGELEQIVSSTTTSDNVAVAAAPQVDSQIDVGSDNFFAESHSVPLATNEAGVFENDPTDMTDFSDFERELADQLNPNAQEDLLVEIPEAPELLNESGHRSKGLGVTVAVLGVAAVVASGAFGWNYFSENQISGPAPVILASTEPVKIKPKDPGGIEIPNQDQVVFEQVNGNSQDKTSQERLASGAETPIRVVTTNSVPPVIEPLPVVSSDPAAAKSSARISPSDTILVRTEQAIISPRKVRTVVVRPDGTIVAAKKPILPGKIAKNSEPVKVASISKESNFTQPASTNSVASTAMKTPPIVAALPAAASTSAKTATPVQNIKIVPASPKNREIDKLRTITAPAEKAIVKPVAIVPIKKVKVTPIKKAAAPKKSKPVKLATASTGGYVMQISSQRSAEAAQSSYNRLSKRFSSILGGKGVDIRRFKLKDKGIYYRVRVPAGSKKSAINLCTRYKSAGGSCFVTR